MKTYVVRVKGLAGWDDQKIVGIVRVKDLEGLFELMDEFANPHDFEYHRVVGECASITLDSAGPLLGDGVCQELPDEEDGTKSPKWKTFLEMCGGEEQFKAHWNKWNGKEYNHDVASIMGNEAP